MGVLKKDYITFQVEHEYKNLEELEEEVRKYLFEDSDTPLPSKLHVVGIQFVKDSVTSPRREWKNLVHKKSKRTQLITEDEIKPTVLEDETDPFAENPFRREFSLKCPKCKKKCKSRSGFTLHKKRCK